MEGSNDYFSVQSDWYAKYRPTYPDQLYRQILQYVQQRTVAWDCATGNGQCATHLSRYFKRVVASDNSWQQLAKANPLPNVHYLHTPAENTPFPKDTFDLITVAQALHWFDTEAFFEEVNRVGKDGAVIAVWGYGEVFTSTAMDEIIRLFYHDILKNFWPPQRHHIDTGYSLIHFPFNALPAASFEIEVSYTFHELMGYFQSWSASQHFQEQRGQSPVELIREPLLAKWGKAEDKKTVKWPVFMKIGRIEK